MKHIPIEELAAVHGGFKWQDLRPSENVEDRRGMTPRESTRAPSPAAPPLPQVPRSPGDLPSQLGIDDIGRHGRRRR